MLYNLTMNLILSNVYSESPPIDTPLLICLTRSFFSIMSKGLLNSSTEHLVGPSRSYVAASIGILFASDIQRLQAQKCIINSAIFSPNFFGGPSWENCLSQAFKACTIALDMKNISSRISLRLTIPPCSRIGTCCSLNCAWHKY